MPVVEVAQEIVQAAQVAPVEVVLVERHLPGPEIAARVVQEQ
jgi:hypothetical protein